jgi:hypothetical protein
MASYKVNDCVQITVPTQVELKSGAPVWRRVYSSGRIYRACVKTTVTSDDLVMGDCPDCPLNTNHTLLEPMTFQLDGCHAIVKSVNADGTLVLEVEAVGI